MSKRKIILASLVTFLSLSSCYASTDDLQEIVGKAAAVPSRSLTAEGIVDDEFFKQLFSKAGEELRPTDPKTNYFTAMKIAKDHNLGDLDAFLNQMGIPDTYPINSSYTGKNKSAEAYDVWVGEREGDRVRGQAEQVGREIGKGAEKVANTLKGIF
ncbi:MAG: hypothetical protein K2Q34_07675 [Alphaproteobacteria bacterium]|nr:hypothetical protein [Alphaproteobacteria bacterium]